MIDTDTILRAGDILADELTYLLDQCGPPTVGQRHAIRDALRLWRELAERAEED